MKKQSSKTSEIFKESCRNDVGDAHIKVNKHAYIQNYTHENVVIDLKKQKQNYILFPVQT